MELPLFDVKGTRKRDIEKMAPRKWAVGFEKKRKNEKEYNSIENRPFSKLFPVLRYCTSRPKNVLPIKTKETALLKRAIEPTVEPSSIMFTFAGVLPRLGLSVQGLGIKALLHALQPKCTGKTGPGASCMLQIPVIHDCCFTCLYWYACMHRVHQ